MAGELSIRFERGGRTQLSLHPRCVFTLKASSFNPGNFPAAALVSLQELSFASFLGLRESLFAHGSFLAIEVARVGHFGLGQGGAAVLLWNWKANEYGIWSIPRLNRDQPQRMKVYSLVFFYSRPHANFLDQLHLLGLDGGGPSNVVVYVWNSTNGPVQALSPDLDYGWRTPSLSRAPPRLAEAELRPLHQSQSVRRPKSPHFCYEWYGMLMAISTSSTWGSALPRLTWITSTEHVELAVGDGDSMHFKSFPNAPNTCKPPNHHEEAFWGETRVLHPTFFYRTISGHHIGICEEDSMDDQTQILLNDGKN